MSEVLLAEGERVEGYDIVENQRSKANDVGVIIQDKMQEKEYEIYVPCAKGMIIQENNIDNFKIKAICGAANGQVINLGLADELYNHNILYIPDYLANAGGLIAAGSIYNGTYDENSIAKQVCSTITNNVKDVLKRSLREKISPLHIANEIVESRLKSVKKSKSALHHHGLH